MSTKICVCVRTRDEERRIGQLCEAWKDADHILIADGGSIDKTKEIASSYNNTIIIDFPFKVQMANGYWRNDDSAHANFLFKHAYEMKIDWIIYDDCDCRPNFLLKRDFRAILEGTKSEFIQVVKLYLWGLDKHFPHLATVIPPYKTYYPSLFAWQSNVDFWTVPHPPAYDYRIGDKKVTDLHRDADTFDLYPPYCMLHYSWDDPARVEEKMKIYRKSGLIPGQQHPLDFGGPLEDLPWFAHE